MNHRLLLATLLIITSTGKAATDRVQNAFVVFRTLGEVQIEAEEPVGDMPRLLFTKAKDGTAIQSLQIGESDPKFFTRGDPDFEYPKLRFRVMHVNGLPNPLVVAVGMMPGGSDCGYEPVPIGLVGTRFQYLLPHPVTFTTQDGFAIGELGKGRGRGFAVINYVFDENEQHYQAHRFTIEFYKWDTERHRFDASTTYTTKNKTDAVGAGIEAGIARQDVIDFQTLLKWFPAFSC